MARLAIGRSTPARIGASVGKAASAVARDLGLQSASARQPLPGSPVLTQSVRISTLRNRIVPPADWSATGPDLNLSVVTSTVC